MAFTRQDRTLSGGKSNVPLIRKGVPDSREGFHGDIAFVEIDGIGIIQYIKIENIWKKVGSQSNATTQAEAVKEKMVADEEEVNFDTSGLIKADGSVPFTGNQSHGGFNITSVGSLTASATVQAEQLTSTDDAQIGDDLTVIGDINVDGEAKLDKTTIDTADGAFTASGANPISLTATGSNDISLSTTAGKLDVEVLNYDLVSTRTCDWDTSSVDWDNSDAFTLTSVGNVTVETSGASTARTITILNDNTNASAFSGIHIKTNGQNTGSCYNGILIECDGVAAKGASYGIDLRSENNILIRGEDANGNNAHPSTMKICSTGNIDIGAGFASSAITIGTTVTRTQVHGVFETSNLWRNSDAVIFMDRGHITDDSATGLYTKFEAIDTYKLIRAMTFKASATVMGTNIGASHVSDGSYSDTDPYDGSDGTLRIVPPTGTGINHDDNVLGTVWKVTVYFHYGTGNPNLQVYWCYATTSSALDTVRVVNSLDSATSPVPILTWSSSNGIFWTNEESQDATVKASALRVQSGTFDF